jgi:hypothetical protein
MPMPGSPLDDHNETICFAALLDLGDNHKITLWPFGALAAGGKRCF